MLLKHIGLLEHGLLETVEFFEKSGVVEIFGLGELLRLVSKWTLTLKKQ